MKRLLPIVALLLWPSGLLAQDVQYYHLDAIGNVRAVTDQSGTIVERHDYLPFGEECTTGQCVSNQGMTGGQPKHFTGKERDTETGLDYFGARYYRGSLGRFTSVDPAITFGTNVIDPQRWNRYAYGRDNPLRYLDPDGRMTWTEAQKRGWTYAKWERDSTTSQADRNAPDNDNDTVTADEGLTLGAGFVAVAGWEGGVVAAVDEAIAQTSPIPLPRIQGGTEIVQRAMSRAEARVTEATGLVRGGREGTHFVSDSVNSSAQRARQRLALGETPEVRVTMQVPAGKFSPPSKVAPKGGLAGGGTERTATGHVTAKVLHVDELKK